MALDDLSQEDLERIVVEAVYDSRTSVSVAHLLRLVHGDERVPARVKDEHVLAALTVAVERGWLEYYQNPQTVLITAEGLRVVYSPGLRPRAEAYGIPVPKPR